MLRIALKILLALSLLMQGSVAAFAVGSAALHAHSQHGMQHDAHSKTPCCPDCSTPADMAGCPACMAMLMTAQPYVVVSIEPVRLQVRDGTLSLLHGHTLPPMRPPIA